MPASWYELHAILRNATMSCTLSTTPTFAICLVCSTCALVNLAHDVKRAIWFSQSVCKKLGIGPSKVIIFGLPTLPGVVQVDRYKQLLLKQRDIMIALTGRLNERDEQILTLQEELEAYDAHQK